MASNFLEQIVSKFDVGSWRVVATNRYIDISPVDDLKLHFLGTSCWCNPTIDIEFRLPQIIHNAEDGRP